MADKNKDWLDGTDIPTYNLTYRVPDAKYRVITVDDFNGLVAQRRRVHEVEKLNTPEIEDFVRGIEREAKHQRVRWATTHDSGKTPEDWFWLIGYLAGKCLAAFTAGDRDKALHHTISTAAVLLNWHAAIKGTSNSMRPGITEPKGL